MKKLSKRNKKVAAIIGAATLFILLIVASYVLMLSPLNPNGKEFSIYISSLNDAEAVENEILDSLCKGSKSPNLLYYKWKVATAFKSADKFPPGKYNINGNFSSFEILKKLNSGNQDPVSFRIDNIKTIHKLAERFGKKFEQDSVQFIKYVNENLDVLAPNTSDLPREIREQRVLERLLGDTYEFYWTSSPENFFSRLNKLYSDFWTSEKESNASSIGLTEHQVYVLASIVRGETANQEEAPQIAGLYLNRLQQNMLLQSDPTVLFGINTKEKRQRVRHQDLKFDSPYNTYLYKGLPPATIHIVEKTYLDAVLNAASHDYIFMCAQPGGTGKHNFAITYQEHQQYAKKYQLYLDSIDIQR